MQFGLLSFDYYTSDTTPTVQPCRGLRIAMWNTVRRGDTPKGWMCLPWNSPEPDHTVIANTDVEDMSTSYGETFRSYARQYKTQTTHSIIKTEYAMFLEYYSLYALKSSPIEIFKKQVASFASNPECSLECYLLVTTATEEVVAGIATVTLPDAKQSYYVAAFTRRDIAPQQGGFWLCYRWMLDCRERGVPFINLGVIWREGQPNDWKGFSNFKLKFHPIRISQSKERIKVTFSLKG
jgi:hypothetical protein